MDFDGDLDLAVSNVDAPATLLRNDSEGLGRWLRIDAPGAVRVEADAAGRHLVRHLVIGGSFLSVNDPRHHFGLGAAERVDRLTLIWPDGFSRELRDLPAGRAVIVPR
jgi:hypothetical protein